MQKLNITKSQKDNYYIINKDTKVIQLVHPELAKLYISNANKDVSSYYINKKEYLANYGCFQNDDQQFQIKKITAQDIVHNIITTSQIIFEVTDKCNFQCKYCGYGELYSNYDQRNTKHVNLKDAISLINYYFELCRKHNYKINNLSIGFYGGEPLVNFEFIKEMIRWLEEKYPVNYSYNTTTNGVLLDRYIDYLVDKNFNLSISLDGDEYSNSYRVDCNGLPTFQQVIKNVNYIREKYPSYYNDNVSFTAVLHNRNAIHDILSFFERTFSKIPRLGRLNDGGIHGDKIDLFREMYTNTSSFNYANSTSAEIMNMPFLLPNHLLFLQNNLFSIYKDYLVLLSNYQDHEIYPTATCSPLKRKIYLTVNGKIIPCEKIGHNYSLGYVSNGITHIDFDEVAQKYNEMYKKIYDDLCSSCNLLTNCLTCVLQSELKCRIKKGDEEEFFQSELDIFELQPDLYNELTLNATLK